MGNRIRSFLGLIFDPDQRFVFMHNEGLYDKTDDRRYLKKLWKYNMGYDIDLDHPVTFNEKIQWLKLNDRDPVYTTMVDKIEAKKWVADRIGDRYITPTLGVWDDPEKIDFDALPDRFVLKCNHNSGLGMCICTDKAKLDVPAVIADLKIGLAQDYYLDYREWAYKDVKRRILAEEYIDAAGETGLAHGLIDYKVHCFSGEPDFIEVIGNRDHEHGTAESDIYDFEWRKPGWRFGDYPAFSEDVPRPDNLAEMYEAAKALSKQLKYARIDFYSVNSALKFGEITLYPNAGMVLYNSDYTPETDAMLGNKIKL